jgi:hypothetical protein
MSGEQRVAQQLQMLRSLGDVQEIIGSRQVSEAHRSDAFSHNIRKVLQDGRQFQ